MRLGLLFALSAACGGSVGAGARPPRAPDIQLHLSIFSDEALRYRHSAGGSCRDGTDPDAYEPRDGFARNHEIDAPAASGQEVELCLLRAEAADDAAIDVPSLTVPSEPASQHWLLIVLDGEAWWVDHHDDADE